MLPRIVSSVTNQNKRVTYTLFYYRHLNIVYTLKACTHADYKLFYYHLIFVIYYIYDMNCFIVKGIKSFLDFKLNFKLYDRQSSLIYQRLTI